jgi:transaldolase
MQFFLDTANLDEIQNAMKMGMVDGVTTNPSLISKENCEFYKRIKEICDMVPGPVSAEVISLDLRGMVEEAKILSAIAQNVVIKIPMTTEGLAAVNELTCLGIKTNVTLVFSAIQALMAAKAGATYVSPFIGRLDDISQVGMDLIADTVQIYNNYAIETQIIVASVRNPVHVLDAAKIGADVATIPFKVIKQLAHHPLTDIGIDKFLQDWEKAPK